MTLIFKGLLWQNCRLAIAGGVAVEIPTAPDTQISVVDYAGNTDLGLASIQRVRTFHIENETWGLAPFLAFLATPRERFFTQGFLQFDFPLNSSDIIYSSIKNQPGFSSFPGNQDAVAQLQAAGLNYNIDNFTQRTSIDDQILMHVDIGGGFWVVRDPCARWLTGMAPSLELHYTTTLDDADIVTLTGDPSFSQRLLTGRFPAGSPRVDVPGSSNRIEPQPQVGNQRNRLDILDLTVGNTFLIRDRATLATGFAFPLRRESDRTFDWEFQVQFNYYFGGIGRPFAPTSF
jgi:hypothetical protein